MPRRLRGTCIASAECCASAKIFTIWILIRACWLSPSARPDTRWSRRLTQQVGESSLEGIVASSVEPAAQVRGFRYFRGGHPTPNAESIHAANAIRKALDAQTAASLVIFLLSGGGSSIVEKPIDDEISLDDLIATYRALVHSGAPIAEINAIRKHLSAVKGGRLAQAAFPAQQVSLLVSDVPDNTARCSGVRSDHAGFNQRGGLLSHRREAWIVAAVSAFHARIV